MSKLALRMALTLARRAADALRPKPRALDGIAPLCARLGHISVFRSAAFHDKAAHFGGLSAARGLARALLKFFAMTLRTRLDVFSTALLSALGASTVVACGGSFAADPAGHGGSSHEGGATASSGASAGGSTSAAGGGTAGMTSGSGGAVASAGENSGGTGNHFPCKNPSDLGGGWVHCDGFVHRTQSGTCSSSLPRPEPIPNSSPDPQCKIDADCTEKPYGFCETGGQLPGPYCQYGCVLDSDCSAQQVCVCGSPVGRCQPTTGCTNDSDCQGGLLCRSYDSSGGCQTPSFACQGQADECAADADCPGSGNFGLDYCGYDTTLEHFSCKPGGCQVGRPFLIEGEARVSAPSARADWREPSLLIRVGELDAALRAHLSQQWTRAALLEHASIAAFARFSLQLLSLGAPPDLIERATAAMADETRHAKACFAVASAYAGAPVGPGRLAVEDSLEHTTLEQIVLNTIREGCVGETVAAIEAREASEHAADPALRALLLTISEDETRHAELAFRFVKWALTQGDGALEQAVQREFSQLAGEATEPENLEVWAAASLAHGIAPESLRRVIRARAVTQVILPCARALCESDANRSRAAALDTSAP